VFIPTSQVFYLFQSALQQNKAQSSMEHSEDLKTFSFSSFKESVKCNLVRLLVPYVLTNSCIDFQSTSKLVLC